MKQKYKSVYFPDYPAESSSQKALTLAFGKHSTDLYQDVHGLSSAEMRQLLGTDSYQTLLDTASEQGMPLNTYCLNQIRDAITYLRESSTQLQFWEVEPGLRIFDPVTATFKAGAQAPFVRWYPYLEGYSPQFVETVLTTYAPNARRVLDPFAGTGTTAFVAASLGKQAFYCEVNPVLQFMIAVKARVRLLHADMRGMLAAELVATAATLDAQITQSRPSDDLETSYYATFGDSRYFPDDVFTCILQIRSWLDELHLRNSLLADVVTVGALAMLIPTSHMTRAGDLRFKTAQEQTQQVASPIMALAMKLFDMANDIRGDLDGIRAAPVLIAESAQSLDKLPSLMIDAVVTSPPYVNGTNYFRNTKIELWFLRCLRTRQDLTRYRAAAITAGINDVTVANTIRSNSPGVRRVVEFLEMQSYDARIPRMIDTYFADLEAVFASLTNHLTPEATIAIDIGDSAYAGVHVPVDELLVEVMDTLGFERSDVVPLRQRKSRSGAPLKQVLLVFKHKPARAFPAAIATTTTAWEASWEVFKTTLPHQQPPFSQRNWGHGWHSLCSYMGKLKPAIAYNLVHTFVPDGGKLLDPFAGVGTIPFEASLQGKRAIGFDISPAALAIANAKVNVQDATRCGEVMHRLAEYIDGGAPTDAELAEARELGFNGKIADFYEERTLSEIILARRYFQQHRPQAPEEDFVFAALLHILHGNRPYALSRRSHPITPYQPTGEFVYKPLIARLNDKVQRALAEPLPQSFFAGRIYQQDATTWWPREIDDLDAVITSPPFFDSTRFYLANWLRLWFAGWSKTDFETAPRGFVDERQKQSFDIYTAILRQARERLKQGGVVVLHLGKSRKCDMAAELLKVGRRWFSHHDLFNESVDHCESHGIRDKGTVTSHQYLVLY
jgi:tRNA G10  N-methylase Trm11